MPAIGFSTASTTLAARAIGRQDEELRKIYFKELLKVGVVISSITSLLLIFLPRFFMTLMTDKPELQAIGVVYVFVMGFIQIPQNLSRIYNGTIRAMGYKKCPHAGGGIRYLDRQDPAVYAGGLCVGTAAYGCLADHCSGPGIQIPAQCSPVLPDQ